MASILSKLDELGNEDDENNDVPDLLRKYVLGENEEGRNLNEIGYNPFIDDPNSITDAHETVLFLNELWDDGNQIVYYYIKYNNVGYKIVINYDENEVSYTTMDVIKVYEPNGDEGEIVEYSVDGTVAKTADWLVLYDNGTTVDMTPIALDENWTYILGAQDPAAIAELPSGTDLEKAIWSYNHAVETLNEYCETIVTNSTAQAVRSVGTRFGQEDTSRYYTSTFLETVPNGLAGTYNGVNGAKVEGRNPGLEGDMNAEQDVIRMSYFSPEGIYQPYGYASVGEWYNLASRSTIEDEFGVSFYMRGVLGPNEDWGDQRKR